MLIKESIFFGSTDPKIPVVQLPIQDDSIDWGKVGSAVDWVGIGVEGVGYVMIFIPVVQAASPVIIAGGKGLSAVGTGMEIYDAAQQEDKTNLYVVVGATALSEVSSIPINKLVDKKVFNLTDKAILETQKNVVIEYTEGQITK